MRCPIESIRRARFVRSLASALGAVLMAAAAAPTVAWSMLAGDLNGDTQIDVGDVVVLHRHLNDPVGSPLTAVQQLAADVAPLVSGAFAADGAVNNGDLTVLTRYVSGHLPSATLPTFTIDPATAGDNPVYLDGQADADATIRVYVNGRLRWTGLADSAGIFRVPAILFHESDPSTPPGVGQDQPAYSNAVVVVADVDGVASAVSAPTDHLYDPGTLIEYWKFNTDPQFPILPRSVGAGEILVLNPGNPQTRYDIAGGGCAPFSVNDRSFVVESGGILVLERGSAFDLPGDCIGIRVKPGGELRVYGEEGARVDWVGTGEASRRGISVDWTGRALIEHMDLTDWDAPLRLDGEADVFGATIVGSGDVGVDVNVDVRADIRSTSIDGYNKGIRTTTADPSTALVGNTIIGATTGIHVLNEGVLVEGNEIRDPFFGGTTKGIIVHNADAVVRDNWIHTTVAQTWNRCLEILVNSSPIGREVTVEGDNDLSGCDRGIYIEGVGQHVITGATVSASWQAIFLDVWSEATFNFNNFDAPTLVVIAAGGTTPFPINGPIDLRNNYWGTAVAAEILAKMTSTVPDNTNVDLSGYLDQANGVAPPPDTNLLGFPRQWSFLDLDTSGPGAEFKPTAGSQLAVGYSIWEEADIELFVYETDDSSLVYSAQSPPTALVATLVSSSDPDGGRRTASGTPYVEYWDGRDDSGQLVPDGIYVVLGKVTPSSTSTTEYWEPTVVRPLGGPTTVHVSRVHNTYRNRAHRARMNFGSAGATSFPQKYVLTAHQADPLKTAQQNFEAGVGSTAVGLAFSLNDDASSIDVYSGLRDVSTGDLVSSLVEADFSALGFGDELRYQSYAVLVRDSSPKVQGPDEEVDAGVTGPAPTLPQPPAIEVKADPYFLHWSYDQTTTLKYCVDVTAEVTAYVLRGGYGDVANPGAVKVADLYDPHSATPTALVNAQPTPVPSATWCPPGAGTPYEAVLMETSEPPDADGTLHSFVLEARRVGEPLTRTVVRGVVQIVE